MRRALWRGGAGGRQGRAEGRPAGPAAPGAAVGGGRRPPPKTVRRTVCPAGRKPALRQRCAGGGAVRAVRMGQKRACRVVRRALLVLAWIWRENAPRPAVSHNGPRDAPSSVFSVSDRLGIGAGKAGFLCCSDNVIVAQRRREGKKEWHLRHNQSSYCQFFFQNHPECDIILHNTRNRREQYGKNCGMR